MPITTERQKIEKIVGILNDIPEKKLMIFDVLRRVIDKNGQVDVNKAMEIQPEINLAKAETEAYIRATQAAIHALEKVPAITEGR